MFVPLDSLEELKISCWPAIKLSVLDLLTPSKGKKHHLLPSLTKLHLTARTNEMTPGIVRSLLTMTSLRRALTKGKLDHLALSYSVRPAQLEPWPLEFIEGMSPFVQDGMNVVIKADDGEVEYDWLRSDTVESSSSTSILEISDADPRA
jgi:hypothetical protein